MGVTNQQIYLGGAPPHNHLERKGAQHGPTSVSDPLGLEQMKQPMMSFLERP